MKFGGSVILLIGYFRLFPYPTVNHSGQNASYSVMISPNNWKSYSAQLVLLQNYTPKVLLIGLKRIVGSHTSKSGVEFENLHF